MLFLDEIDFIFSRNHSIASLCSELCIVSALWRVVKMFELQKVFEKHMDAPIL